MQGDHADDVGDGDLDGGGVLEDGKFEGVEQRGGTLIEELAVERVLFVTFVGGEADVQASDAVFVVTLDDGDALSVTRVEVAEVVVLEGKGFALFSVGLVVAA